MATGAEVVFKGMCFEVHGLEFEVRQGISMIMELELVKVLYSCLALQVYTNLLSGLSPRDTLPD